MQKQVYFTHMYMYILHSCRAIKRNGLVSDYKLSSVTHIDTKNMRMKERSGNWKMFFLIIA